jgi:RNA polymerase sigma factor (sigma-70 family)
MTAHKAACAILDAAKRENRELTPDEQERVNALHEQAAAQQALAADYVPLARRLAMPFKRHWPQQYDEFDSAAMLALVQAAAVWDATRGCRFATFARHRILGGLRDAVRAACRQPGLKRHRQVIPGGGARDLERLGHVLTAHPGPDVAETLASAEEFERRVRSLPPNRAAVCRAIYGDGLNQAETAQRVGLCQTRVSTLHRELLAMLAGTFGRAGFPGSPQPPRQKAARQCS